MPFSGRNSRALLNGREAFLTQFWRPGDYGFEHSFRVPLGLDKEVTEVKIVEVGREELSVTSLPIHQWDLGGIGTEWEPCWSPDGSRLAMVGCRWDDMFTYGHQCIIVVYIEEPACRMRTILEVEGEGGEFEIDVRTVARRAHLALTCGLRVRRSCPV